MVYISSSPPDLFFSLSWHIPAWHLVLLWSTHLCRGRNSSFSGLLPVPLSLLYHHRNIPSTPPPSLSISPSPLSLSPLPLPLSLTHTWLDHCQLWEECPSPLRDSSLRTQTVLLTKSYTSQKMQWNLSNPDTLGTGEGVLISEVFWLLE